MECYAMSRIMRGSFYNVCGIKWPLFFTIHITMFFLLKERFIVTSHGNISLLIDTKLLRIPINGSYLFEQLIKI